MATQKPKTKTAGISKMFPSKVRNEICARLTKVIMMIAQPANISVERVGRTVAAIVTGAKMSNAKGLFKPPVKAKSSES